MTQCSGNVTNALISEKLFLDHIKSNVIARYEVMILPVKTLHFMSTITVIIMSQLFDGLTNLTISCWCPLRHESI